MSKVRCFAELPGKSQKKMPGCMWQLLLDAFKFMILQQGWSVHRGGAVEACTIHNTFNVFENWVIVPRTGGRWEWPTAGLKPWLCREFHLCELQCLIQTMKYLVSVRLFIVENEWVFYTWFNGLFKRKSIITAQSMEWVIFAGWMMINYGKRETNFSLAFLTVELALNCRWK